MILIKRHVYELMLVLYIREEFSCAVIQRRVYLCCYSEKSLLVLLFREELFVLFFEFWVVQLYRTFSNHCTTEEILTIG